jgi:hypothetical protein
MLLDAPPAGPLLGSTLPRIWTPPRAEGPAGPCGCGCALTPATSLGFAVETFARDLLGRPLDPWQRWTVIHALEMMPNGWPRFRQVLVLVARQNGKTELCVILTLFWMFVLVVPLVLGTSTKLDYAKESWTKALKLAKAVRDLAGELGGERRTNGEQEFWTAGEESRYKIAASNEEGGRSLTVHRLIEDELRQHYDWSAHEAAENAMNAVGEGQAWAISNMGDKRSVVLNSLRQSAHDFIDTGVGDDRLFLAEYSAPEGCDVDDVQALAYANPNLGRRIDVASLLGKARRAKKAGGEQETKFRTEVLCQQVDDLKPKPVTAQTWADTEDTDGQVVPAGRPSFFVTIEKGARSATIAVATIEKTGPHVELADHRGGTAWLAGRLVELQQRNPQAPMAAMKAGPVADLTPELSRLGVDLELLPGGEMIRACGHLEKLRTGFTHSVEQLVDTSLAGAEVRYLDQATWAWDWKTSRGDLSPIAAETMALWLAEKHREDDYDLMNSAW